mgnify:CR=1 FL=1
MLIAAACGGDRGRETFVGYYYTAFETSNFVPGVPCRPAGPTYWLVPEEGSGFQEALQTAGWQPPAYQAFFVRFEGELSEPGRYGHLGAYEREVRVLRALEVRAAPECIEPSR